MSESILTARAGIFPCPNCRQMIYSDAKKCRFCKTKLDRAVAESGADIQKRVNSACNQAKILRNAAVSMWAFFILALIPFSPTGWAGTAEFTLIPFWLIYWQVRFGNLQSLDKDYERAKRDRRIAFYIWLPAVLLEAFPFLIIAFLRMLEK
jgi:hypothetical protein